MPEPGSPDPEKIRQKVQFLRDALRQLEQIRERGEERLASDPILLAAAIRYLQVGIEAILDSTIQCPAPSPWLPGCPAIPTLPGGALSGPSAVS
jgi:hypothetical protein